MLQLLVHLATATALLQTPPAPNSELTSPHAGVIDVAAAPRRTFGAGESTVIFVLDLNGLAERDLAEVLREARAGDSQPVFANAGGALTLTLTR